MNELISARLRLVTAMLCTLLVIIMTTIGVGIVFVGLWNRSTLLGVLLWNEMFRKAFPLRSILVMASPAC